VDAEVLVRALERGGIPVAHVLSPHRRELRRVLGVRRALVEAKASYITTIRGLLREQGEKLRSCDTEHFVAKFRAARLKQTAKSLVEPLVVVIETIESQLAKVEEDLGSLCRQEPVIARLATTPGVGAVVAAAFVSVVDDAGRFAHSHQVESYVGLVPCERTTGGKRRLGAISKKGNGYLRGLLVQGAWGGTSNQSKRPTPAVGRSDRETSRQAYCHRSHRTTVGWSALGTLARWHRLRPRVPSWARQPRSEARCAKRGTPSRDPGPRCKEGRLGTPAATQTNSAGGEQNRVILPYLPALQARRWSGQIGEGRARPERCHRTRVSGEPE
jgi:hypothetical protein